MENPTNKASKTGAPAILEADISSSAPHDAPNGDERDERPPSDRGGITLPDHAGGLSIAGEGVAVLGGLAILTLGLLLLQAALATPAHPLA